MGKVLGQSTFVSHLVSAISRIASHTLIILLPQSLVTHANWIHQMGAFSL